MARINLGFNLDDVESGFEVYPDGIYHVRVKETSKLGVSKSGNPKLELYFEIIEPAEYAGKTIPDSISLQDQSDWVLKGFVEASGLEYDEKGFDSDDTFGLELLIELGSREFENKPQNDVKKYMAVGTEEPHITQER